MTYTEKELNQFLHGISQLLLSKKSAQHWRYDEETAKEIEWLEALERKVRADKADRKTENSSEKPNNCEHITEDGVTCAKYPACDDCLDNPLNKVKGSERLVKGKDEPQTDCYMCKWLGEVDVCGRCRNRNLFCEAEPQPRCPKCGKRGYIRSLESMGVKLKVYDEYKWKCTNCNKYFKEEPKDEPQTERSE